MSARNSRALEDVVAGQLADPDSHWGLGTFGAIAEFVRDQGEPVSLNLSGAPSSVVTARGGIRIQRLVGARAIAFETATGASWNQHVALCLREGEAAMNRRAVLTELAPDVDALRVDDEPSVLFDLGLGIPHIDACVRVDPAVAERLRQYVGQNVFAPDSMAMHVILAANPHRVFISRCGRIEVYQPIPPQDGRSPEGPHTHVLPKLLAHARTHAATDLIPEGWMPCLSFYPAHPLKDALGRNQRFMRDRHDAFQSLLAVYGDPTLTALKKQTSAAVAAGAPPPQGERDDRFSKGCIRITLRQAQASGVVSPSLGLWLAKYERPGSPEPGDLSGCH